MENAIAPAPLPKLGILAGGGELPKRLVEACIAQERPYFILGFEGSVDVDFIAPHPHAIIRLGAVGEGLGHLKAAGAEELVLAGRVNRPGIASLRPDAVGAKLLARIGKAFLGGG